MTTDLHGRLDTFESDLRGMQRELGRLRAMAEGFDPIEPQAKPKPYHAVEPIHVPAPQPAPAPAPVQPAPPRIPPPRTPRFQAPDFDVSAWLGARSSPSPVGQSPCSASSSSLCWPSTAAGSGPSPVSRSAPSPRPCSSARGVWARRRYGDTDASVAAAGAGIAGGYATLLFAAAKYELLPDLAALGIAAAIAAVGTAAAIAWRSQILAGLGLLGAMAVPFATVLDPPWELTSLGTAFAAVVLVAAAVVALRERWLTLLASAGVVGLLQIGVLVAQTETQDRVVTALATVYWLIALGIAAAAQWRNRGALDRLPAAFVTVGTAFAGLSAASLWSGNTLGYALLVVGGIELALGIAFAASRRLPELGALLFVAGLSVAAVACGVLLEGPSLALAWSAEAAVLGWLAPTHARAAATAHVAGLLRCRRLPRAVHRRARWASCSTSPRTPHPEGWPSSGLRSRRQCSASRPAPGRASRARARACSPSWTFRPPTLPTSTWSAGSPGCGRPAR